MMIAIDAGEPVWIRADAIFRVDHIAENKSKTSFLSPDGEIVVINGNVSGHTIVQEINSFYLPANPPFPRLQITGQIAQS